MRLLFNTDAAPSAALPAGAVIPATPAAPSAPDFSTQPINPADFHRALTASMVAAETPPTPAPAPALESPAVPAVQPVAMPPLANVPEPVTPPASDDAEPSAEVLASLSEPGQRALQNEREKRKAARAELAEAKAEIAQLKADKLQTPAAPVVQPGQPPTPAPAPSAPPVELSRCETFDAVDACAMQASSTEATALHLNTVLATEGLPAVQDQLKGMGIEKFRGVAVDDLTAAQLAGALADTMQHARGIQLQANNRKAHIAATGRSMDAAVTLVPGLKDPNSESGKQFSAILAANPGVRNLGTHWPELVAKQIFANDAITARTKAPTPLAPVMTPAAAPAALSGGPAAPRTSAAAIRQPSEQETLAAKIMAGTATQAEVRRKCALDLAGG